MSEGYGGSGYDGDKNSFKKTDGVIAYHGYQSFAEGEVTPDTAHEIGKALAKELWGDRFVL